MLVSYFIILAVLIDSTDFTCASDIRLPPTIVRHPTAYRIYKRNTKLIVLECVAVASPPPRYDWNKDGRPLGSVSNILFVGNGTMHISRVTWANEGIYQCFAGNIYGHTMSTFAELRIAVTDITSPESKLITAAEGQPVMVDCQPTTRCFPAPHYSWKFKLNDRRIPIQMDSRRQIDQNGNLHFAYVNASDTSSASVRYACYLKNSVLDTEYPGSYTQLTVTRGGQNAVSAPRLAFSSEPQLTVFEGHNAVLKCFFYGRPVPAVTWSRVGGTLPSGRHNTSHYGTQLTIWNVSLSDSGVYECHGRNSHNTAHHRISLNVEAVPVFTSSTRQLHNVNVTEGDSVSFTCQAYAQPPPTVVWLRNTVPLDVNELPAKYSLSADGTVLTVFNVCRDCVDNTTDVQVIQCNASNQYGYAFAAGYLNVLRRTRLEVPPQNTTVNPFDLFAHEEVLRCIAASDPSTPPVNKWYRLLNGSVTQVNTTADDRLVVDKDGSLIFRDVAEADWRRFVGWYRCEADNGYTSDSADLFLDVLTSPIVPTRPPDKTKRAQSGASMWWIAVIVILAVLVVAVIVVFLIIRFCCCRGDIYQLDAIEQRDGKRPLKELEERSLKPYKRREDRQLGGSRASLDDDEENDDFDDIH